MVKKSIENYNKKIQKLREAIQELENKKEKLRLKCAHINKKITYGGDTGNYDPTQDRYWKDVNCPDCEYSATEFYDRNGKPI